MDKPNKFPAWLEQALAGRNGVYLVKNSGTKDNGRPVIDDSRVSKWKSGAQRPSMELAVLAARVLGRPPSEALKAAGYTYGYSIESLERMERKHPRPPEVRLARDHLERLRAMHSDLGALLAELDVSAKLEDPEPVDDAGPAQAIFEDALRMNEEGAPGAPDAENPPA